MIDLARPELVAVAVFAAVVLAVLSLILGWEAVRRWRRQRQIGEQLQKLVDGSSTAELDEDLLREEEGSGPAWLEPIVYRLPGRHDLKHMLDQADVDWSVGTFLLLSAGLAAGLALALLFVTESGGLALLGAVAGAMGPYLHVRRQRRRRFDAFEKHFAEAIDLLGRAIRAGHAFSTGIKVVSEEASEPVAGEFRQVFEEHKFGLPVSDVLLSLADRVSILDVRIFVTAVLIQIDSGGNLAEILDNLAEVIRERFRFRRQLKIHTAHGRMTAMVLAAAPIVAGIGMYTLNPEYMSLLFTEPLGRMMLLTAAVLQVFGFLVIRRIIAIEV